MLQRPVESAANNGPNRLRKVMNEQERNKRVVNLATNDELKLLTFSNFNGNQRDPHHCDVKIISGRFSFQGGFYFDNFSEFTSSIENMAEKLVGTAELKEDYKDQSICLEVSSLGHVLVSGVIEEYSSHAKKLNFGFKTDQTCLSSFGKDLRKIIE